MRPATLLSDFGEGYCRWCYFVVGLTPYGLLMVHDRSVSGREPARCKGSDTVPPKVTPYATRKAAFRVTPVYALCPGCGKDVPTTWTTGYWVYGNHAHSPGLLCDWRYRTVAVAA